MSGSGEEERVAVALPLSLVLRVEALAAGTDRTREELVEAAVEAGIALDEAVAELLRDYDDGGPSAGL